MTCLHNHDQILEFLRKLFLKGFQIYQNYLCALTLLDRKFFPHKNKSIYTCAVLMSRVQTSSSDTDIRLSLISKIRMKLFHI